MLKLTLQDLRAGGFKDPLSLADPSNEQMIIIQQAKLQQYPERYSGFTRNDELVAYVKQNDWTTIDEFPFTPWYDVLDLAVQPSIRTVEKSTSDQGCFCLCFGTHNWT